MIHSFLCKLSATISVIDYENNSLNYSSISNFKKTKDSKELKEIRMQLNSSLKPILLSNENQEVINFLDLNKMANFIIGIMKEKDIRSQVFTEAVLLEFNDDIKNFVKESVVIHSKEQINIKDLSKSSLNKTIFTDNQTGV